jgi:hypothetical protein
MFGIRNLGTGEMGSRQPWRLQQALKEAGLEVIHFGTIIPEHLFDPYPPEEAEVVEALRRPEGLARSTRFCSPTPTCCGGLSYNSLCLEIASAGRIEERPLRPLSRAAAVILFGSTRGDFDQGSDLDVLIVIDDYDSAGKSWSARQNWQGSSPTTA